MCFGGWEDGSGLRGENWRGIRDFRSAIYPFDICKYNILFLTFSILLAKNSDFVQGDNADID